MPRCEIKIDATTKTPKTTRFSVFYFAFRAVFRTFRAISRVRHIMKNFGCHLMILPVWEDLNHHPTVLRADFASKSRKVCPFFVFLFVNSLCLKANRKIPLRFPKNILKGVGEIYGW